MFEVFLVLAVLSSINIYGGNEVTKIVYPDSEGWHQRDAVAPTRRLSMFEDIGLIDRVAQ